MSLPIASMTLLSSHTISIAPTYYPLSIPTSSLSSANNPSLNHKLSLSHSIYPQQGLHPVRSSRKTERNCHAHSSQNGTPERNGGTPQEKRNGKRVPGTGFEAPDPKVIMTFFSTH